MRVVVTGGAGLLGSHLCDPVRRRPVVDRALDRLGRRPEIPVEEGLRRTIAWLRCQPSAVTAATTAARATAVASRAVGGHACATGPAG